MLFKGMGQAINIKPKNADVSGTERENLYFQLLQQSINKFR